VKMSNARELLAKLRSMFARSDGNIAILMGITIPAIVGCCGLGADAGYWYFEDRNLQNAADVAAYDGGVALSEGDGTSQVTTIATAGANANQWDSLRRTITVNTPPTSGSHQNTNSVEVIITENAPRFFSAIFSSGAVPMTARAVSTFATGGMACILGLDSTAKQDITVSGSASVQTPNCDIVSDSNASNAIDASGSSQINAACLVAVGTVVTSSGTTETKCKTPTNGSSNVPDPYASVAEPSITGSCISVPSGTTITLSPGNYCHGLSIGGGIASATFQPGLYYVAGDLAISSNASGSGVTFFVTAGHQTALSGGSTTSFSAPTSGTYKGIVFFGSRSGNTSTNNNFSGSSNSSITGAIYYPTEQVTFSGSAGGSAGCTQVVADTITLSGSDNFSSSCSGDGMANIKLADGSASNISVVE
jgi:hypothetical protein